MAESFDPAEIKHQIDQLLMVFPEMLEDEILRADMIEGQTNLHEFLRMLERRRQESVTLAEAISLQTKSLSERKARFDRRDEAFRKLMFDLLQRAGATKPIELPEATLSIRNGVPKVIILDEELLPKAMWRIKREPDKIKIKEALGNKKAVPGAVLSNAEAVLAIRIK